MERIKGGVLSLLSANLLNKMVSMLNNMILTRILTGYEYGIWTYILNIYSYLIMIAGLGLSAGAFQFGAEARGTAEEFAFYKYCIKKGTIINFCIVVAVNIIVIIVGTSIAAARGYFLLYCPFMILQYLFDILLVILRCQNRISEYALLLNYNTALNALGICVGAFIGLGGIILGAYLAMFTSIIYAFLKLSKELNETKRALGLAIDRRKKLWKYSLFTGASSAMNTMVYILDMTMIANVLKDAVLIGNYKVGTLIPNAMQFIPGSIIAAFLPNIIYQRKNRMWLKNTLFRIYSVLFIFNGILMGSVVCLAKYIILLLAGEKYLDAVPILRILMMGYFFSGTFRGLSCNVLAVFHRVKYGLFISIVSIVCDVVFNLALIPEFGMRGAACATLLVDIVSAFLAMGYMFYLMWTGRISEEVN